jgi:hypothetical protein
MAYYIFLKSLRSLEEFRKILMPKFLLNLFLQISKALVNSKIQFLFGKEFSFAFGPIGQPASQPSQPPAFSFVGRACTRPILACAVVAYWPKYVSFFTLCNLATTPSPSVTAMWGPPVSSIFHLASADPGHAAASLGHPASASRCRVKELTPRLDSPS